VEFLLVYVREAHPIDGTMPMTGKGAPLVEDPLTLAERKEVATTCVNTLDLGKMTALVDDMEDSVNQAYGAWPDRLYLVGADGTVKFQGEPGPRGFDPEALAAAIDKELKPPEKP
jgi:hypothetical protein